MDFGEAWLAGYSPFSLFTFHALHFKMGLWTLILHHLIVSLR